MNINTIIASCTRIRESLDHLESVDAIKESDSHILKQNIEIIERECREFQRKNCEKQEDEHGTS